MPLPYRLVTITDIHGERHDTDVGGWREVRTTAGRVCWMKQIDGRNVLITQREAGWAGIDPLWEDPAAPAPKRPPKRYPWADAAPANWRDDIPCGRPARVEPAVPLTVADQLAASIRARGRGGK